MKKGLILAMFMVAIVFVAGPAFASVQNIKVSGEIDNTWLVRDQFDLGTRSAGENYYQNLIFTQSHLHVDADLTDNVSTTLGLINERAWGDDVDATNDMDIHLAYVTLREMLYSPLTVIIGRQAFAYGNSFVMDATGTNNNVASGGLNSVAEDFTQRTKLDSVRLVFDYNPLTVDVVAGKVTNGNLLGTGLQDDDVDLFGTNANWQLGDQWNSVVEGYFWAKIDQSTKSAGVGKHADTVYMPGVHVSTSPIKGLNLQGEVAIQRGNKAETGGVLTTNDDNVARQAQAAQLVANYMLPFEQTEKWSPVLTGVYTYVSGDNDVNEEVNGTTPGTKARYTAWDPMFENQSGGTIYNTLFDLTNAHILTAKAAVKPIEDVTATLQWDSISLDRELSDGDFNGNADLLTLRQPDGGTAAARTTSKKGLGNEYGLGLVYDYTEDVQFGAKYSIFKPGRAFHKDNRERASQYIVNANVKF